MATITPTIVEKRGSVKDVVWDQINQDDEGGSTALAHDDLRAYPDKTVSFEGTFDTGAYTLEGSNDGLVWFTCYSIGGSIGAGLPITATAKASAVVAENFKEYRIANDNNGTTEDVNVRMSCSR